MDSFEPAPQDLFFKSQKTGDPRLGQIVGPKNDLRDLSNGIILAGYPDDEGIALNQGRVGAAEAPNRIRKYLYRSTPPFDFAMTDTLWDLGNLALKGSLDERHLSVQNAVCAGLSQNNRWIGLGGGHDFGYPDGAGFLNSLKDSDLKPLIINFDAHLDVRPMDKGPSSGTPFYRLLTDTTLPEFDFTEIGIQSQCNSESHLKWCKERGVDVITWTEIMSSGLPQTQYLLQRMAEKLTRPRPTFVSIDIDGFSSAFAMGCSQSWATGFDPNQLFPFFDILYRRLDVRALGVYEVSPPLDLDDRTSKLASQIVHQFIETR